MAICRFSETSDVYLYQTEDGFLCCGCSMGHIDSGMAALVELTSINEAILHIKKHITHGDKVPHNVIEELKQITQN